MGTKVIFVGGSGRSGTTLLARMVGQVPGYVAVGEVREIWRDRAGQNRFCGCGAQFAECPFWRAVGDAAFGGWSNVDHEAVEREVGSFSWVGAFQSMLPSADTPLASQEVAGVLSRLYAAISEVGDGATVVDTSKGPPYGVALASVSGVEMRAIHLVRDVRGITNSWIKEIPQPYTPGRLLRAHKLSAVAATRWLVHNSEMELLSQRIPSTRVIYERFAERPAEELLRAMRALHQPVTGEQLRFMEEGSAELHVDHTVAGNPNRHSTGTVRIKPDTAWQERLSLPQRAQVTGMTWPMLLRYGYAL